MLIYTCVHLYKPKCTRVSIYFQHYLPHLLQIRKSVTDKTEWW